VKWKEVVPLPVRRSAHTAVLLHGLVYVGGGSEGRSASDGDYKDCYRLDVYNLTTNRWNPSPITTPHCWFAMTVLDDKLIIAGGKTKSGKVTDKILVLDKGEWKDFSKMPTVKASAVAVGYQSFLIVVGGNVIVKRKWFALTTTELLDTTNGFWHTCDDLPLPYLQLKAAVVNNTLYLLGGKSIKSSLQVFTASLDNLSSHQLKWQSLPDTPWCFSTPVVLHNKFLLTVGGRQPSDMTSQTREVCAFNPSTGSWKQIANIPAARSFPAVVGVTDGKIILLGGMTNTQQEFSCDAWIGVFE